MDELAVFLVKAKAATYASGGEGQERNGADFAKELTFSEGAFRYVDRYYGFSPFSGIEVVWFEDAPIWSMTYYGMITSSAIEPAAVYRFLREAMMHVGVDRPFRGPQVFEEEAFSYRDRSKGDLGCFSGVEEISYRGEEVYRLMYQGGSVRLKGYASVIDSVAINP